VEQPARRNAFVRFLAPGALLAGAAAGFLACCLGGRLVSRVNLYQNFERFHLFLTPDTLYYPTPCQLRALGRSRLDPGKVAVVVGGTSRLHGTGQTVDQCWTRKLQQQLGDRFQVLNFGFRGARTCEIGLTAAEALSPDYPRMIFITDCYPCSMDPAPDGHLFKYFFWSACYKGLLLPDAKRLARLQELAAAEGADKGADLKRRAWLDSLFYFDDLWNAVAYARVCTAWSQFTRGSMTRPRREYADPEPLPLPLAQRYVAERERALEGIRNLWYTPGTGVAELCVKDGAGRWVENPRADGWATFRRSADSCFPESLRPQTLVVMLHFSPYYLNALSPDEHAYMAQVGRLSVRKLEDLGFASLSVGEDCTPEDYADLQHLTESGGAKLAEAVAGKVRAMAERLHYLD
jgi:hypothetical protein